MLRWTVTVLLVFPVTDPAFAQSRGEWYWRSPERPAYYGPAYRDGPPPDYRLRSYPYERDLRRYWLDEDEPPRYRSDLERRRWEDEDPRARVPDRGLGPAIVDGGPRPSVRPIPPTQIAFGSSYLPDWHPPAEMRQRDPRLPEKMTGGVRNPLGAKALYLGNTLYRIHGTDDARTIGQATSSGCFRMTNGHVVDLAHRVDVGAKVIVVNRLPSSVARSSH